MAKLTDNEKNRYHRHLILNEIGEEGQERIRNASVLVAGAGGLGCPVLQYLTAAGVGRIGVMDDDTVDVSNLQRQVFYGMKDIGKHKAIVASQLMKRMNSNVSFDLLSIRINYNNALEIADGYDILVDCTDNLTARYVLNDTSVVKGIPLVHASVYKYQGQLSVFGYRDGPSYRCLFPKEPEEQIAGTEVLGIYSVLPGIIGLMQVNEVLKIITGAGNVLSGRMLVYNAFTSQYNSFGITRQDKNFDKKEILRNFVTNIK